MTLREPRRHTVGREFALGRSLRRIRNSLTCAAWTATVSCVNWRINQAGGSPAAGHLSCAAKKG